MAEGNIDDGIIAVRNKDPQVNLRNSKRKLKNDLENLSGKMTELKNSLEKLKHVKRLSGVLLQKK